MSQHFQGKLGPLGLKISGPSPNFDPCLSFNMKQLNVKTMFTNEPIDLQQLMLDNCYKLQNY